MKKRIKMALIVALFATLVACSGVGVAGSGSIGQTWEAKAVVGSEWDLRFAKAQKCCGESLSVETLVAMRRSGAWSGDDIACPTSGELAYEGRRGVVIETRDGKRRETGVFPALGSEPVDWQVEYDQATGLTVAVNEDGIFILRHNGSVVTSLAACECGGEYRSDVAFVDLSTYATNLACFGGDTVYALDLNKGAITPYISGVRSWDGKFFHLEDGGLADRKRQAATWDDYFLEWRAPKPPDRPE